MSSDAALVVAVRKAKPGSARRVPLHPATAQALRGYARLRDRHFPAPAHARRSSSRPAAPGCAYSQRQQDLPRRSSARPGLERPRPAAPAASPRPAALVRGHRRLLRLVPRKAPTSLPCSRCCRPISATSTRPPLIGTCRPHPSCSERQRTGWRQPSEIRGDGARPDAPGVLHRPADGPAPGERPTVAAYRDTLRLLLCFAEARTGKAPSVLDVEDLDVDMVGAFLATSRRPPQRPADPQRPPLGGARLVPLRGAAPPRACCDDPERPRHSAGPLREGRRRLPRPGRGRCVARRTRPFSLVRAA